MHRLTITHVVTPDGVFLSPEGEPYIIAGDGTGLDQIAEFARALTGESGETVVFFEVFWPWETEEHQTWDALRVDVSKIDAADPDDWWVSTLPPYAELSQEQRVALGIDDA